VPEYLARLEAEAAPDAGSGAPIRAALRGDLHLHSDWSDGGAPIEAMARKAAELGHQYLALTDHSPKVSVAHGLDAARLRK
jgi:putative hydrolase